MAAMKTDTDLVSFYAKFSVVVTLRLVIFLRFYDAVCGCGGDFHQELLELKINNP